MSIRILGSRFFLATILVISILAGVASFFMGCWDYLEPIFAFITIGMVAKTMLQTTAAKKARYTDNGDGDFFIAVKIGDLNIFPAARNFFGQLDCMVDASEIIGTNVLSVSAHYEKMAKTVIEAVTLSQNKRIHIICSGTVGFNFYLGQFIGNNKFDVVFYQYDFQAKTYFAIPKAIIGQF